MSIRSPGCERRELEELEEDEDEFDDAEFMATHGVRAVEMIAHEIETKERLLRDLEHRAELERARLAKLREVSASLTEVHVRRRTWTAAMYPRVPVAAPAAADRASALPGSLRSADSNKDRASL